MDLVPLFELKNNWVHSYLDLAGADYSEISGDGKNMLFLVASGTAVRVEHR